MTGTSCAWRSGEAEAVPGPREAMASTLNERYACCYLLVKGINVQRLGNSRLRSFRSFSSSFMLRGKRGILLSVYFPSLRSLRES